MIDTATAPLLDTSLRSLVLDRGRYSQVSVDLRHVNFCDPTGLRVLAAAEADLRSRGGVLVLHGPCPPLQMLLDLLAGDTSLALSPISSS